MAAVVALAGFVTSSAAGQVASSSTPTPTPPPGMPDPNSVTPGVLGFLVIFLLALVTWLLMRNMTGRLRRMRFREEHRRAGEAHPHDPPPVQPGVLPPDDDAAPRD